MFLIILLEPYLLTWTLGFITPNEKEPVCPGIRCLNDGTLDMNTCICQCKHPYKGFKCEDMKIPSIWPQGKYSLPASMYGCPEDENWKKSFIRINIPSEFADIYWEMTDPRLLYDYWDNDTFIDSLRILGPYSERSMQLNLCEHDGEASAINSSEWQGNFCIISDGSGCHNGFVEGKLSIDGYSTEYFGILSEKDTFQLSFCCKEDTTPTTLELLPDSYPFVLLKGPSVDKCENKTGFQLIENTVYFPVNGSNANISGTTTNLIFSETHIGVTFCVYENILMEKRPGHTCNSYQFQCINNMLENEDRRCLNLYYFCEPDPYLTCEDKENNRYCSDECGRGMVSCSQPSPVRCVPLFRVCDGIKDCYNGEDEMICHYVLTDNGTLTDTEVRTGVPDTRISVGKPLYKPDNIKTLRGSVHSLIDMDGIIVGQFYVKTEIMKHPWFQVDLQETFHVSYVIPQPKRGLSLQTIFVHFDQWSFRNRGAEVCFHGLTLYQWDIYTCRRPIFGQYLTLLGEGYGYLKLGSLRIFGSAKYCSRPLGMISGDIKDFQIHVSSNYRDLQYSRALFNYHLWCPFSGDTEPWIMVDLIVPTVVHGLDVYWKRQKYIVFMIVHGIKKTDMIIYREMKTRPEVFILKRLSMDDISEQVRFHKKILVRFIQVVFIRHQKQQTTEMCISIEIIGCPNYGTRSTNCDNQGEMLDFGFASIHETKFDKTCWLLDLTTVSKSVHVDNSSINTCNNLTISEDYFGNTYNIMTKECLMFNISRDNRHFDYMWTNSVGKEYITSERLCFKEFYSPTDEINEYFLAPGDVMKINSPFFPSTYGRGYHIFTYLSTREGSFIQITIIYASLYEACTKSYMEKVGHSELEPSRCNDTLTFDIESNSKIVISKENQDRYRYAIFISNTNTLNITFKSCVADHYSTGFSYQIRAEVKDLPGCGMYETHNAQCYSKSAYLASPFYSGMNKHSDVKRWEIHGKRGQYIQLDFFDIDFISNSAFSYSPELGTYVLVDPHMYSFVEVFDFSAENERSSFGRFTTYDISLRSGLKSSWERIDVEFRIAKETKAIGFYAKYTIIDMSTNVEMYLNGCDNSWTRYNNNCYRIFDRKGINQFEAEDICRENQGHLVSINREPEMTFIHAFIISQLANQTFSRLFIGLTKMTNGLTFTDYVWENGEPLLYTAWYRGNSTQRSQPDGHVNEKCTAIILHSIHNSQNWHDVPCMSKNIHHFICEKLNDRTNKDYSTKANEYHTTDRIDNRVYNNITHNGSVTSNNTYRCLNDEYVSRFVVCDGSPDCSDNSDEDNCELSCSELQYKCNNGECIHLMFYCDGKMDCHDNSDEEECVWLNCKTDEWQCRSKQCIPINQRCDLKSDCYDQSDENDCVSCRDNSFQCYDGTCIDGRRECDKVSDCISSEDEGVQCIVRNVQDSCKDWWVKGARSNGTYHIVGNLGGAVPVYCQFDEVGDDHVNVSEIVTYKVRTHQIIEYDKRSYNIIKQSRKWEANNMCSQTFLESFYFIHGNMTFFRVGSWKAISRHMSYMDWRIDGQVNKISQSYIYHNNMNEIPINIVKEDGMVKLSKESFYETRHGPLICSSKLSKNVSSNQYLCRNEILYETNSKCILDFDEFNYIKGCRDMSHLQDCGDVICPNGFFKCPEGHCVTPRLVCDGNKHCISGDDEVDCEFFTCPGLYRCQNSTTCLLDSEVCDGVLHCRHGDDEVDCNITCPGYCNCDGLVYSCSYEQLEMVFHLLPIETRKIKAIDSRFSNNILKTGYFPYLFELILTNCNIQIVQPGTFTYHHNMMFLDLSFNIIEILYSNTFEGLRKLTTLVLTGNKVLQRVEPGAFSFLDQLKVVSLTGTYIDQLNAGTFQGLKRAHTLNISHNKLYSIEHGTFKGLNNLEVIDITNNFVQQFSTEIFSDLDNLKQMFTDSYVFCCLKPKTVSEWNCSPKQDAFSSCSDLIRYSALRVCLWVVYIAALLGNTVVICYRVIYDRILLSNRPHDFFVFNLSISDLLTGVYLAIIAIADLRYHGNYVLKDSTWRSSVACNTAGVLAAISSEGSVSFLLAITVDRFLAIKYPFGNWKLTMRSAILIVAAIWLIVTMSAVLPLIFTEYFSSSFYTKVSVCLALPFASNQLDGWEYISSIYVFYNMLAFSIIAYCQILIFREASNGRRILSSKTQNDVTLARKLFLVVFTDFLCWFPIGTLGILSLTGQTFPSEVYALVAVFVLPVNAALNPFLYTFSNIFGKQERKWETQKYKNILVKQRRRDQKTQLIADHHCIGDVSNLKYMTIKELTEYRKLRPVEIYQVILKLTTAVVDMHKHSITFSENINMENVCILFDSKGKMTKIKVTSTAKDIYNILDTCADVESIGKITKCLLRKARTLKY